MAQENTFLVKGTQILVGSDQYDFKSTLIEDADISPGESTPNKTTASDGTDYSFVGDDAESTSEFKIFLTEENFVSAMNSVYGLPTTVIGDVSTWDMSNPGGTVNDISIISPVSANSKQITYRAVNAKGLVIKPEMPLGNGHQGTMKFVCDRWEADYDISA